MTNREEDLKKSLCEFSEEIIFSDPEWHKERRVEYLVSEVLRLLDVASYWRKIANAQKGWWYEAVFEAVVRPEEIKIRQILGEIELYEKPIPVNYDNRITDDDITRAKETPLDVVSGLDLRIAGSNRKKAICPFHDEKTASFVWYVDQNSYHCYSCGKGGTVIDFVMETTSLSFKEAVKRLTNKY